MKFNSHLWYLWPKSRRPFLYVIVWGKVSGSCHVLTIKIPTNKKVLLRKRKRHTARKRAQDADPPPAGPDPPLPTDLTPPLADWPDPPPGWTWPPPCRLTDLIPPANWTWPPPSADWPDPPQLDLTPPPIGSPDLIPPQLDLTPPQSADWPDPPPGWTWPPPRQLTWPDPPPVDKLTKWNYYLPVVLRTRAVISEGTAPKYFTTLQVFYVCLIFK